MLLHPDIHDPVHEVHIPTQALLHEFAPEEHLSGWFSASFIYLRSRVTVDDDIRAPLSAPRLPTVFICANALVMSCTAVASIYLPSRFSLVMVIGERRRLDSSSETASRSSFIGSGVIRVPGEIVVVHEVAMYYSPHI